MSRLWGLLGVTCLILSCTSTSQNPSLNPSKEPPPSPQSLLEPMDADPPTIPISPPKEAEEGLPTELFLYPSEVNLPPHPAVEKAIQYYAHEGKNLFQEALKRLEPHFYKIKEIFTQEGIDPSYLFMGIVESLFKVKAHSRAGARGPWQFMASTAKLYNLHITPFVDERLHWEKATQACAKYLKDLFDDFGDEKLALAAYNAGKGKIRRAQRHCKAKSFWKIRRCLPKETRQFVPSVLASIAIGKDPEKYGFSFSPSPKQTYHTLTVETGVHLATLETCLNLPKGSLRALNPHLILGYSPPMRYQLRVPLPITKIPEACYTHHTIKPGESLSSIARLYGISYGELMRINHLTHPHIKAGQSLRVPAAPPWITYKVKRGDTLWGIARKFGVSLHKLKRVNGLHARSLIHPGQILRIPRGPIRIYKVKKGDTLYSIAKRFGTTIQKLMKQNRLLSPLIKPGDKLLIR